MRYLFIMSTKRTILIVIGSIFLVASLVFIILMATTWADASANPLLPILLSGVLVVELILGIGFIVTLVIGIILIKIGLGEPDNYDKVSFGKCIGEHPNKEAECKIAVRKYGNKYENGFTSEKGE